jgi:multimeric flavodoxin WrbA
LCTAHMTAMRLACEAAAVEISVYELPEDEEPIACQACHLTEVKRPKIILH